MTTPRERHRQERASLRRLAEDWQNAPAPRSEDSPGRDEILGLLPANQEPTAKLPLHRRRRLTEHLRELVDAIDRAPRGIRAPREPSNATPHPALRHACATCRGHCCLTGGDHAYLGSPDLRRFWSTRPHASGRQIVDAYLAALPERSYAGSCVFHAASGCTLPREMRAELCNVFLCDDARALETELGQRDPSRTFLVAAGNGELVRGLRVNEKGRTHRVRKPKPTKRSLETKSSSTSRRPRRDG